MPPQQPSGLLDIFDEFGDFRAHDAAPARDVMV
jgi:hypothetical protein